MKKTDEMLVATKTVTTLDRMVARGQRISADDPIVRVRSEAFAPAPPLDGTMVATGAFLTRDYGLVTAGRKFRADDELVRRQPELFVPGPVEPEDLEGIRQARAYNAAPARAKRVAEHERALAKQAEKAAAIEERAAALDRQAEEIRGQADAIRAGSRP